MWTKYYFEQNEETKKMVQDAVNWIFPWGYHWYGRPDHLKGHPDQLTYRVRKWTNDTMRAKWLKSATDFADRTGLEVPARFDEETDDYVIDGMPYPMTFDAEKMDWEWEETTWDRAIANFKKGCKDGDVVSLNGQVNLDINHEVYPGGRDCHKILT